MSETQVTPNFDNTVDLIPVKFNFKKTTDEAGLETKRPSVEFDSFPVPSIEGVAAIFNAGGKGLELLLEAARDVVLARARELVNENESMTAADFPFDQVSWDAIANLPKAERRGGGISKEVWEEFAKDYMQVMPAVTGKGLDKITMQAKVLLKKFADVKTNKPILQGLKAQLALYINNTPNGEQFQECYEFLTNKADTLLNVSDENLLANLGI
jgi:hypothetical protein